MDAQSPSASAASRSVTAWFARHCRALPWLLSASLLTTSVAPPAVFAAPPKLPLTSKKSKPAPTKGAAKVAGQKQQPFEDSPQAAKSVPEGEDPIPQNELKVELNYWGADWAKVLKELAEGTNSVLIADRVPSGRYTRRDKAEYSRTEAVRIINREIEPHGFRVIEKGQYLIVLDLPSQRPRYQTPVVDKTPKAAPTSPEQATTAAATPQRKVTRVIDGRTLPASPQTPKGGVQLAGYEEPATEAVAEPSQPTTMVVFRARNQRANELAKRIYRTFKNRAELVEAGRNGLPSFRVSTSKTGTKPAAPLFSMAIDEVKEELLIDAPLKEADALVTLLRRLDTHTLEEPTIQLVASTKSVCDAAVQLPAKFVTLQAAHERLVAQAEGEPPATKDPAEMPADAANEENKTPKSALSQVISNLKGQVGIEAVEDLNVLIMTGNEADLEKVMKVIRELEKLSQATAPEVHVLYLKHVNSDALAELLTTVYERLARFPGKATQPRQGVAILPVSKPNAILIVAPTGDIESITELAEELDAPVNPETELQVFSLENSIATQVEETLTEFYEDPTGLGTRIVVKADARSNTIIVQASPRDLDTISSVIRRIDKQDTGSKAQLRVYQLKNAVASELMAVLTAAINSVLAPPSNTQQNQQGGFGGNQVGGGGQVAEQFRGVKSTVLEILADGPEGRKLQSGILADIRITSDPRMNSLLVTAPEASQSLMAELIANLDRPTGQVAEIKVFTLANADATQMVQQLQALFNPSATGQTGNNQQRATIGIQVAGAEDASSGLIPLRFSVDTRTNSVIAIGASDAMNVVNSIIFRLDESDARGRQESIYRLKNSPATTISDAITQFLNSQRDIRQQDPNQFSSVEQLEREVIVVPEPVSNSLLVSATPRYFDEIMKLIQKLDEAPKQVIIQALLVEVTLDNTDELGVELGFQDSILFDRSILDQPVTITQTTQNSTGEQLQNQTVISQSGQPGFLFGNPSTPLGNNLGVGGTNKVGSQSLSNFSLGRVNGDLGYGGLVMSASSESVSMLLRALSANRQTRVLSRPQIRTLDNQQAEIFQGQNVPIVSSVNQAAAGTVAPTTSTVQQREAGIILTVTPRISPDGNVVMQLQAEKSKFDLANGVPIFTDQTTGNTVRSPIQDISRATSTIMVPNGQTVVLGGLITSSVDNIERKVPWLGDIPLLGWAFRYDYQKATRTELLIFLTPRIITDDAESEHISEVEIARMHFIESEAEEIHGPLRGVPAGEGYPVAPLVSPTYTLPPDQMLMLPGQPMPIPQVSPPPTPAAETPAPPQPGVYEPSASPAPAGQGPAAGVPAPPGELPTTGASPEPQLAPGVQPSLYEVDQGLMDGGSARVGKNSKNTLVSSGGKKFNPLKLPAKATAKQQASSPGTVRLGR